MKQKASYDVIVIGTGSAGFAAVQAAVREGARVCVIEHAELGGECPNFACIPSKALLKTARVFRTLKHAREFGIRFESIAFDFEKLMAYRADVVETITGGKKGERYETILETLGVEIKRGRATFLDDHLIDVQGQHLFGKTFVIATGSLDKIPPINGFDTVPYKTWKEALMQTRQPKSMAIIGGGPVGCELATFYATFGTRVVLLQQANHVLPSEDQEISVLAQKTLIALGVDVRVNADIASVVDSRGGTFGVRVRNPDGLEMIAVDQIVLAAGRRAAVDGLALDQAGVALDASGSIKTTKQQRTSVRHIFAAGDVNGGERFTHMAHVEGSAAGSNAAICAKKKRSATYVVNDRVVPRVTFVQPEVASVGYTAEQVKKAQKHVLVGRWEIAALGRATTDHARAGLLKIVAHPKTRKVLGGHMIGERAGEVIHEVALAIFLNTTVDKLAEMIHAFPTYSEAVGAACSNLVKE